MTGLPRAYSREVYGWEHRLRTPTNRALVLSERRHTCGFRSSEWKITAWISSYQDSD